MADQTWEEHIKHLRKIFQICRTRRISLKRSKCYFGDGRLDYLGHKVGSCHNQCHIGVPSAPTTKKGMQSFLGLIGYYHTHIPRFSSISAPLSDLVQKKRPDKIA